MMRHYNESVEIICNKTWTYILDHPYRILIISGWGSDKTNVLLNLIKHKKPDSDKIYCERSWKVEEPFKSKYQQLINRRE